MGCTDTSVEGYGTEVDELVTEEDTLGCGLTLDTLVRRSVVFGWHIGRLSQAVKPVKHES